MVRSKPQSNGLHEYKRPSRITQQWAFFLILPFSQVIKDHSIWYYFNENGQKQVGGGIDEYQNLIYVSVKVIASEHINVYIVSWTWTNSYSELFQVDSSCAKCSDFSVILIFLIISGIRSLCASTICGQSFRSLPKLPLQSNLHIWQLSFTFFYIYGKLTDYISTFGSNFRTCQLYYI